TAILKHMFTHRGREVFMNSLAHCGIDGTLEKRMKDIRDRVIAKTGYIQGVCTLAGYVHTADDHWLAFAFYYNHAPSSGVFKGLQDSACRLLATGAEHPRPA